MTNNEMLNVKHKTFEKISKYFLIIIFIFLTIISFINKANSKVLGSTTIEGVLIDDVTKQPISDALITAGGQTVKSDKNGRYVISGLLSGKIIVEAKKDGYDLFCESISVNKGVNSFNIQLKPNNDVQKDGVIICNNPSLNITNKNLNTKSINDINTITLIPKFSSYISAQVIDIIKNIPISQAKVEIDGEVYFSDANGELISKPLKKSEILVKVEAKSYQSYESNIKIKSGKNNVKIYLMPLSKETPTYVAGINQNQITEYAQSKQRYNDTQKNDENTCNKPAINNNEIQSNKNINNIALIPKFSSYISAQVIDIVKNIPISRAKVEIDGEVYFSDANGELISKPIKKSEILVKVEATSYQSYESNIKIKSGKNNVKIYLMPLSKETPMYTGISQNKITEYTNFKQHYATLSGYVRDFKTKAPIANATVIVGTKSTQTNYQGFYNIEGLSMGSTSITVIAGNYGVYKGNIDINKITNVNDISLVFEEKLSTITGTVVEKETGKPIYGAQIKLGNKITLSDEYGSFKISDVPYDYYNLIVEQKGYQKVEKAISVNQEKITVVVELADEFTSYKN